MVPGMRIGSWEQAGSTPVASAATLKVPTMSGCLISIIDAGAIDGAIRLIISKIYTANVLMK
jgi:hypothetical protein